MKRTPKTLSRCIAALLLLGTTEAFGCLEVRAELDCWAARIRVHEETHGRRPESLEQVARLALTPQCARTDPWERPYAYETYPTLFVLRSLGPDGLARTVDDLTYGTSDPQADRLCRLALQSGKARSVTGVRSAAPSRPSGRASTQELGFALLLVASILVAALAWFVWEERR